MINLRIRRIDVFLLHALRGGIKLSATKGHHLAADVQPRENGTTGKTIVESFLIFSTKTRFHQKLLLVSLALCLVGQGVTLREGKAQLEFLNNVVTDATTAEILLADGLSVDIVLQNLMEILTRPLVHHKHRLTLTLLAFLVFVQFTLLNLNVVFLRQPTQCLGIGNLLVLHQEIHGIAALATGKTLTNLAGW